MCKDEVFGDWYSDCQHFVGLYLSGTSFDCMNQNCRSSSAHVHKAPNCPCPSEAHRDQERRIQNVFRKSCPDCDTRRAEEFDRRVGRKPNNEAQY